jgi:hypothetical protein
MNADAPWMTDPVFVKLALAAWTDESSMIVLSDHLLEIGVISPDVLNAQEPWWLAIRHSTVVEHDSYLYQLECAVREMILVYLGTRSIPATTLKLRPVDRWPDVYFIAYEEDKPEDVKEIVPGVLRQPRLLRQRV